MKKFLVIVAITILAFISNSLVIAENIDKPIKFTETQKKTLEGMVMGAQVAQNRIKEFVDYLVAEYKVDQTYRISQDMSGFEKVPQAKVPDQKPAEVKNAVK